IGTLETVERLESTLASMGRLERFRGHFYNWYETRDLQPLEPRYVSTVDSGNLAGHLIVLGNACREMMERPLDSGEALHGIEDALLLSAEAASQLTDDRRSQTVTRTNLDEAIGALATSLAEPEASPAEWAARLRHLGTLADTLVDVARTFAAERGDGDDAALLAGSGSMFEYLMPALIMDSPPASLLDQTARLVVRRQRAYGAAHGVPWGISESAYNVRDLELTYQYSNFGVPGLGLERGLS